MGLEAHPFQILKKASPSEIQKKLKAILTTMVYHRQIISLDIVMNSILSLLQKLVTVFKNQVAVYFCV